MSDNNIAPVVKERADAVKQVMLTAGCSVNTAADDLVSQGWADMSGKTPGNNSFRNAYRQVHGSPTGRPASPVKRSPVLKRHDPAIVTTGDIDLAGQLEELTAALVTAADILSRLRDSSAAVESDIRRARMIRAALEG